MGDVMYAEQQQIRLIVESIPAAVSLNRMAVPAYHAGQEGHAEVSCASRTGSVDSASLESEASPLALVVPREPAWVWARAGVPPGISNEKLVSEQAILVEFVMPLRQPKLLLSHNGRTRVYVNGMPAPRFVLLKEKDVLRLDHTHALHVSVYNQPQLGPAGSDLAGKECPVCRVPLTAASRCYVCSCGAAMHVEEDEDGLQCAQLRAQSGCPACQRPVVLVPGYSYLPEVSSE